MCVLLRIVQSSTDCQDLFTGGLALGRVVPKKGYQRKGLQDMRFDAPHRGRGLGGMAPL